MSLKMTMDAEEEDADEGDLVDALLDGHGEVAAEDAFDDEQEDHAAVEDGEGQQVEHAEVDGDVGDGLDERHPALHLCGLVDDGRDADGAGEAA